MTSLHIRTYFILSFNVFYFCINAQINPEKIDIVRGRYGTPHIFADTDMEAAYGLAWAHSEDDFKTIQEAYLARNKFISKSAIPFAWSYSSFINFKTQWTKGYRFRKNSQGEEERTELTRFFSPAYLQVGVGLYWKKNKDFW